MNFHDALEYARSRTEVVRTRRNLLYTFGSTRLPYVCLSDSPQLAGDVVIRQGEVTAERPQIALPGRPFELEGVDFEEMAGPDELQILLARRVAIPPARYTNKSSATRLGGRKVRQPSLTRC